MLKLYFDLSTLQLLGASPLCDIDDYFSKGTPSASPWSVNQQNLSTTALVRVEIIFKFYLSYATSVMRITNEVHEIFEQSERINQ